MQNLFKFLRQYYYVFLFFLLEAIAVILIVQNSYYQRSAIVSKGNTVAANVLEAKNAITEFFLLKETNRLLVEENAKLRNQIESSYVYYMDTVFRSHDTIFKRQYEFVEAKVISNSTNKRNNYLMLNRGANDGIKRDMAVVSSQGIVGTVMDVSPNFSLVMSVLHSNSRHSVKIRRTNVAGTLLWEGSNYRVGTLLDIPSTHEIFKGDTVITSGFSQDFPEGIPVGYVQEVNKEGGDGFYKVKILFTNDFKTLNYAYIVTNLFKDEQQKLLNKIKKEEE